MQNVNHILSWFILVFIIIKINKLICGLLYMLLFIIMLYKFLLFNIEMFY